MRLVATTDLDDGARVARDVLTGRSDAIPLLRAGARISPRYRDSLLQAGVYAIYVDDELSAGIEVPQLVTDAVRRRATQAVAEAFDAAQGRSGSFPDATVRELQEVVDHMAYEIAETKACALALGDLSSADSYTLQHSIDVAALGLLIGQRLFRQRGVRDWRGQRTFEGIERQLGLLGLGLVLHDIGKLTIPQEIINKPGELDDREWALIRTHPRAGVAMLPRHLVSPLALVVVRSHHERFDGAGYADGLAGDAIHEFARIAAVADVYDAVTSERAYASAQPPHVGLQVIVDGAGTAFDPEIVEVLRSVVVPYPPGSEVMLSDGRRGVVAAVAPTDGERPLVRIGWDADGDPVTPYEVNLSDRRALEIVRAGLTAEAPQLSLDRHTALVT